MHLELTPNLTTNEFIKCFKRLIARRGRPKTVDSDNAKTFQAAAKWLKLVIKTEEFNEFLTKENINWKLNLPRAPWWGGPFERLIGLTKQSLSKSLGKTSLSWNELESVLLDVEVNLNSQPLTYIEDDIQYPILTPNIMVLGLDTVMLEEDLEEEDDKNSWKKRQKYIVRCKDAAWRRWKREYLRALREIHNMVHKTKVVKIDIGDMVMINGKDKRRGKWKIGIVKELFQGKDQKIRSVEIKTAKATSPIAVPSRTSLQ